MFSKGKRSSSHLDIHQPRSARALFIRAGLITLALGSFVAAGALAVVMPSSPEPQIYEARTALTLPSDLTVLQAQDQPAGVPKSGSLTALPSRRPGIVATAIPRSTTAPPTKTLPSSA